MSIPDSQKQTFQPEQQIVAFLQGCGWDEQVSPLSTMARLHELVARANQATNLTRILNARDFWISHVCDSVSVSKAFPKVARQSVKVADVGTGGGFPALPLAWLNPALEITAIDARPRKAGFVHTAARALSLTNVTAEAVQARELAGREEHVGRYDLVLLRAVGTAEDFTKEVRSLLSHEAGSAIVFYKTPESVADELALARREAEKFGLSVGVGKPFELPQNEGTRQLLVLARSG